MLIVLDCADDDAADGTGRVKGAGNHPNSRGNLKHQKQCDKCKSFHGNKKTGRCGKRVPVLNQDGSQKIDGDGILVTEACDFVFQSAYQKTLRQLQQQMNTQQATLPPAKRMKMAHVHQGYMKLLRKVRFRKSAHVCMLMACRL